MKKKMVLVHGFLGEPRDWQVFEEKFESLNADFDLDSLHLWEEFADQSTVQITKELAHRYQNQEVLFIGYSLGGRLILPLLKEKSPRWSFVFVSTHPGLALDVDKTARLQSDKEWGKKMETMPWEEWLFKWNTQGVFAKDLEAREAPQKYLNGYQHALSAWSLGHQENFTPVILAQASRIRWIVGEEDQKFLQVAQEMVAQGPLNLQVIKGAGHRIPLTHPQGLAESVNEFSK